MAMNGKSQERETGYLLMEGQNNIIRSKNVEAKIDNTPQNSYCMLCRDRDEMDNLIISKYRKIVRKEYKTRHKRVGMATH